MRIIRKTFTPEEAEKVLATKNNINVRKIRKHVVQNYARQMLDGHWHNSWDCIAFDEVGNLLNGQHRLMACVLSGIPLTVFVVLDAEDITGDTGLKRNINETLKGQGRELPPVYSSTFGVAVLRDVAQNYFGLSAATADECYEFASYPAMEKCTEIVTTLLSAPPGVKKASVASAIIGAYVVTKDQRCVEFCEIISSGISNDGAAGSVIAIRDLLMKTRGRRFAPTDIGTSEIRATVQAAIRSYLRGVTTKRIMKRSELIYKPTQDDFLEEW